MPPNLSNPSGESFLDLLQQAQGGSQEALGKVLNDCRCYLMHIAQQKLNATHDGSERPSDPVGETLLAGRWSFPQFRGQTEEEFRGWLRTILVRTLTACSKANGKQLCCLKDFSARRKQMSWRGSSEQAAEQRLIRQERSEIFHRCLRALPLPCQKILDLKYGQGFSFEKIANLLNVSPEVARQRCLRARRAFAKLLEDQGYDQ